MYFRASLFSWISINCAPPPSALPGSMPCVTRAFWNQVFSVSLNDGRCSAQRKFRWGSLHNSERGCWSGAGVLCCGGCSWQRVITESLWWGFVWEDPDLNRLRLRPCWVLVQLYSCIHIVFAFWRSGDRSESACFTEEGACCILITAYMIDSRD